MDYERLSELEKLELSGVYEQHKRIYREICKESHRLTGHNQGQAYEGTVQRLARQRGLICVPPIPPSWHGDYKGGQAAAKGRRISEKADNGYRIQTLPDGSNVARF